jgi:phosphoribosyl-dephospho-CoA transferase
MYRTLSNGEQVSRSCATKGPLMLEESHHVARRSTRHKLIDELLRRIESLITGLNDHEIGLAGTRLALW